MLPRNYRLRGPTVFDHLYRARSRFQSSSLILRIASPDLRRLKADLRQPRLPIAAPDGSGGVAPVAREELRFAVVVSKKVSKRAVVRNRLRRRLHHAFIKEVPHLKRGHWLLLSLKPAATHHSEDQLLQEWNDLLQQSGLRPKPDH